MSVTIATGTVSVPYVVLDSIIGVGGAGDSFFSGPDASMAFEDAKNQLRAQAIALGGDAVINCDFELRDYHGGLNVVVFGTVVKFK